MFSKGLTISRGSSLAALVAATALAGAGAVHASVLTPINLTGFNQDSVVENGYTVTAGGAIPSNIAVPVRSAVNVNGSAGQNTLYESGLNGSPAGTGLPTSHEFTSSFDSSTGFQFQKYTNTNNMLGLSTAIGTTGTLTLTTPTSFDSLAILALSTNAASNSTGAVTLNFAGGITATTDYGAPDWFSYSSGTTTDGNSYGPAINNLGRIDVVDSSFSGPGINGGNGPDMYQTTLNLASLNGQNYTGDVLDSLTFTQAPSTTTTGIFAVSGSSAAAVPDPATLGLVAAGGLGLLLLKRRKTI